MKSCAYPALIASILPLFFASACFTGMVNTRMDKVYQDAGKGTAIARAAENVNGRFPERIFLKTATQTFNEYYYFLLEHGRIYCKSLDGSLDAPEWQLFRKTGLPSARLKRGFKMPAAIVAISADANELQAISDEGRIYQYVFDPGLMLQDYFWKDRMGWPEAAPLEINDLVRGFRSWAVAKRTASVLWYEDRYGNQHHYGTMGIETSYFLCANGQDIRFSDTGLPSDFSHSILGPERGRFIAEALSASASTVFVINAAGEMYTRLVDFDTLGCDPLFFKYTYRRESYGLSGDNYRSNYTPWALPAEDWKKEPPIVLSGKARITKRITIVQDGQGNAARELRVAGMDTEGRAGYYAKRLNDTRWKFLQAPLQLVKGDFLPVREGSRVKQVRGHSGDTVYDGIIWHRGAPITDIALKIPDFNLREGSCHLAISRNGESATLLMHPVDAWTYVRRYDPGRDGMPKLMMVTFEIEDGSFDRISKEFRAILSDLIGPYDRVPFAFTAEATTEYILVRKSETFGNGMTLFFSTDRELVRMNPDVFRKISIGNDELTRKISSPELELPDIDAAGKKKLAEYIDRNRQYRLELEESIRMYESYRISSAVTGKTYSIFNALSHVTLLYLVNFPKINTITRHGSAIMRGNAKNIAFVNESKYRMYKKIMELLDIRIEVYTALHDTRETGSRANERLASFSESFRGYYSLTGMPKTIKGICYTSRAPVPCLTSAELLDFGLPILQVTTQSSPSEVYLIDFKNLPKDIYSLSSLDFRQKAFTTSVSVSPLIVQGISAEELIARGIGLKDMLYQPSEISATLEWTGSTLRIYVDTPEKGRFVFFTSEKTLAGSRPDTP